MSCKCEQFNLCFLLEDRTNSNKLSATIEGWYLSIKQRKYDLYRQSGKIQVQLYIL